MKIIRKAILLFAVILVITLALPNDAQAAPMANDRTIIGESYTLESGRILDGDLNVIGGVVEVETTATVNGNVLVLGGLVTIDGTIKGNLTAIGGTVNLEQNAVIEGDLISPVSYVNIDSSALVMGEQIDEWVIPGIGLERFMSVRPFIFRARPINLFPVLMQLGRTLATTLVMAALGALLLLVMPKPADRMRKSLISSPWQVLGYGTLTALVMFIFGVFLVVTICLIPVLILIGLTFALAILVGWLALGYELGERLAAGIFKTKWHPVLSAALGNLLLYLVAKGVSLIPCLGIFLVFITMLFALGMTVVTLFGTYPYPRSMDEDEVDDQVVLFERVQALPTEPPASDEPETVIVPPPAPAAEPHLVEEVHDEPVETKHIIPIEDLNLGTRINNVLKEAEITTVDDVRKLLEVGDEALLSIDGFGEKSLVDLKQALQSLGYQIPGSTDEETPRGSQ